MLLVIVGEAARRAALERAAEAYRPGIPAEWALNAAQAAARLREEPGSILMLDLGLPACALFAFQELDAAPVCAGTLEELSAAPAWLPRRMAAFLPLEASAAADGGTMPAAPAPLWAYLSDLSRGCGVTLAQSQRAARLLGVPARGRLLTALYAEPCPTRAAATAAERALRENGFQDVCFVPWGQGCMGILNPGQAAGAMEKLCLLIRRALHTQGGRAVTIGLSRAESDPERLPALTEQAELAAFYQIYDGPGRVYRFGQPECSPSGRPFPEMEHLQELNRAATQLDPGLFQIALRHMFDDLTACRLGRGPLRHVLVEVMSLLLTVGLDSDVPASLWSCGQHSLNFEFVYHMEHIEVEYESFLHAFVPILEYMQSRRRRVQSCSSKIRRVMEYIEEHYAERLELPALAELAELSTNYLCHLFKKETGFRVVEYINLIRMERAKELLRARGLSAAQTADAVGFSDTAYFCTMFKRYTGLTVTDFRNRMA